MFTTRCHFDVKVTASSASAAELIRTLYFHKHGHRAGQRSSHNEGSRLNTRVESMPLFK